MYGKCVCVSMRVGAAFFNCSLQITLQSNAPRKGIATIYPVMSIERLVDSQVGKESQVRFKKYLNVPCKLY